MTPLPAIRAINRSAAGLTVEFELDPGHVVFDGHFPGLPILPAVVQIGWAVAMASQHFALPEATRALRALKFLRVVQPPVPLRLELEHDGSTGSVSFAYFQGGTACSTGRIEFADDASRPGRSFL